MVDINSKIEELARNNEPIGAGKHRLAAAFVLDGHCEYGTNKYKSHPMLQFRGKHNDHMFSTMHAEMDACLKAARKMHIKFRKRIKKAKLFVCRINSQGNFAMAKPCENCQKMLRKFGIKSKNVFYTNENGEWERMK